MLTFDTLRNANVLRLPLFKNSKGEPAHSRPDGSDWKLTAWVNATAGELGELSEVVLLAAMTKALGSVGNMAKKIERGDHALGELHQKIADELADVQTYLDILAFRCGIDLGDATLSKWNRVSERVGVPTRIKSDGAVTWVDSGAESV